VYRTDALRVIDLDTIEASGYGFQIEMVHRLARAGAHVREIPITFRERVAGRSKMTKAIVIEAVTLVTRWAIVDRSSPHAHAQTSLGCAPSAPPPATEGIGAG